MVNSREKNLVSMKNTELVQKTLNYFEKKRDDRKRNREDQGKKTEEDLIIEDLVTFFKTENRKERTELIKLSNKYQEMERRMICNINPQEEQKHADWAILTVGNREQPIILSVLLLRARKVFLLHTSGSKNTAELVENCPDLVRRKIDFELHEIDEVDPTKLYQETREIIKQAKIEGKTIVIDPTGGRKSMSAGASAVAFFYRIPMVYLHGYEKQSIIMPFTEYMKVIPNPYDLFGDFDMKLILSMANNYSYSAAIESIETIHRTKDIIGQTVQEFTALKYILEVYELWDRFKHSDSKNQNILSRQLEINYRKIGSLSKDTVNQMEKNIQFLKKIETAWLGSSVMYDEFRIVDLYTMIERRKESKKFEEALALLYRLFEMVATHLLLKKMSLKDPNLTVGEVKEFMVNRDPNFNLGDLITKPGDKLSLFVLNAILVKGFYGDTVVSKFGETYEYLETIKEKRNSSYFGHGTDSVTKEEFIEAFNSVHRFLILMFKDIKLDFDELTTLAKFPKFRSLDTWN